MDYTDDKLVSNIRKINGDTISDTFIMINYAFNYKNNTLINKKYKDALTAYIIACAYNGAIYKDLRSNVLKLKIASIGTIDLRIRRLRDIGLINIKPIYDYSVGRPKLKITVNKLEMSRIYDHQLVI